MASLTHESKQHVLDIVSVVVAAGQTLTIETSPGGEELLLAECPAGETWDVSMHIQINISTD